MHSYALRCRPHAAIGTLLLLMMMVGQPVAAASRALLVGIGAYPPPVPPLEGPANDVAAVRAALQNGWGLAPGQITVLLDAEATKGGILRALDELYANTQAGDHVFIYFSGHGTSAKDYQLGLPLPTQSGAFIPHDVGRPQSGEEFVSRLLVGRTDLRPRLERFDAGGREVLVVMDACYSGNTVRALFSTTQLPGRFVDPRDLLPERAFGDDLGGGNFGEQTAAQEPYPYRNIFYLSASGEHEVAQDIPAQYLEQLPTLDGRPHGAFSDALVRVLTGAAPADADGDARLAYGEIYAAVRGLMQERGFSHTPQRLPSVAEDERALATRPLLGTWMAGPAANQPHGGPLRLDPGPYASQLNGLDPARVQIDARSPHLRLRAEGAGVLMLSGGGDEILRLSGPDTAEIRAAVLNEAAIRQWIAQSAPQRFTLDAGLQGHGRGSTVRRGEAIGFSVRSSAPAYLVLVNIGPSGNMSVLYPHDERELVRLPANQLMALHDLAAAAPPYGREVIDVLAFAEVPGPLRALMGRSFRIESAEAGQLRALIGDSGIAKARSTVMLYTTP